MDRQPQTNRSTKPKDFVLVQYAHKNLQNSINVQDQVADEFEKMSFYSMEDRRKKCSRAEAFICLIGHYFTKQERCPRIKNQSGHRRGGKYTSQQMFPEHVNQNGRLRPGTIQKEAAVLMAYNKSSIPQHGSTNSMCLRGWMEAREILHSDLQWTYYTRFTLPSGLKTGYHSENKVCPSQSWNKHPSYSTKQLHKRPDWSISGSIWSNW